MNIKRIEIGCLNLTRQLSFYKDVLLLPIQNQTNDAFEVIIGNSILALSQKRKHQKFHIAFNIPTNQIISARSWLQSKPLINPIDDYRIHDFDFWKAKAVYFYDADGNLLEFIARDEIDIIDQHAFSPKSILNISEIGIPSEDVQQTALWLKNELKLETYSGDGEKFAAIGDSTGLFIIISPERTWFPKKDPSPIISCSIEIGIAHTFHQLESKDGKLKILT